MKYLLLAVSFFLACAPVEGRAQMATGDARTVLMNLHVNSFESWLRPFHFPQQARMKDTPFTYADHSEQNLGPRFYSVTDKGKTWSYSLELLPPAGKAEATKNLIRACFYDMAIIGHYYSVSVLDIKGNAKEGYSVVHQFTSHSSNVASFVPPSECHTDLPPQNPGLTVGYGIDLAKTNVQEMQRLHVPAHVIDALKIYMGLKGKYAIAAVARYNPKHLPLLTEEESTHLSDVYFDEIARRTAQEFDSHQPKIKFKDLPARTRTAMVDLTFQTRALSKTPYFLNYMVAGQWEKAAQDLRNFGGSDNNGARRQDDADLIQRDIDEGWLK